MYKQEKWDEGARSFPSLADEVQQIGYFDGGCLLPELRGETRVKIIQPIFLLIAISLWTITKYILLVERLKCKLKRNTQKKLIIVKHCVDNTMHYLRVMEERVPITQN